MTDRRLWPGNDRVVAAEIAGLAAHLAPVAGEMRGIGSALADLWPAPDAVERDRQLLFGAGFRLLETRGEMGFGQCAADGYVGWLRCDALVAPVAATHWLCAPASHLYPRPQVRAAALMPLYLGSRLAVAEVTEDFARLAGGGHVPAAHLMPMDRPAPDPVDVALELVGAPYLWGGNSVAGIDCSGLVQLAHSVCGIGLPADSDLQMAAPGLAACAPGTAVRRGDLIFWKGHVSLAVDAEVIVHANGHAMAVTTEPLAAASARIAARGGGPVIGHRRLPAPAVS